MSKYVVRREEAEMSDDYSLHLDGASGVVLHGHRAINMEAGAVAMLLYGCAL
jgi:hypothetical protein